MNNEINIALISIIGIFITVLAQSLIAFKTIRSENERLHKQLSIEFNSQQFNEWQLQFRTTISNLLAATDPEANTVFDKSRIIPLVLNAQLMLKLELPNHAIVNRLINQLALKVNGWVDNSEYVNLLLLHSQLLDESRKIIYRP